MATPFLTTKLFVPRLRPKTIQRPRLIEQLNAGLYRKLTLVSAQAGFGKTTVISQWVHSCDRPIGWFSIDEQDSEPQNFLTYLVAALETISADIAPQSTTLLQSQPTSSDLILTTLLNELATFQSPFILVLDDYHRITSSAIDDLLAFLIEHMPPQMHLVITTREDPQLPLPRLRVRGQMTELRVADLRFTVEEAADFLQQGMGLSLSAENVAALEARTEGWIAALQLVALALQTKDRHEADVDKKRFIETFTSGHHFILDYLVEEVLANQPANVRDFLLQTAILKRLSGPLCDAVTGKDGSEAVLNHLLHDNLFLIPLDHDRTWYRYHHLFADVLIAHARNNHQDQIADWHRRASEWYAQTGSAADAIYHALAAPDFELAAGHIELVWRRMDRSFQEKTWLNWAQALPDTLIRLRPVLCAGYAWALLDTGKLDQIETVKSLLEQAEQWLETPTADMVVVDQKEFESLPATIAAARAYVAQAVGDLPATMRHAQQTLDLLPPDDHFYRGVPSITLAMAQWTNGELSFAFQSAKEAANSFQIAGNLLFELSTKSVMAEIKAGLGELNEAVTIYKQAIHQATRNNGTSLRTVASLHRGLGKLLYTQGDLEGAKQYFETSQKLNDEAGVGDVAFRLFVAQALLKWSDGEIADALELLDKAQATFTPGRMPEFTPIAARKSRILIADGRLAPAEQWARERGVTPTEALSYLREFEHLTLVRLLLARYQQNGNPADLDSAQELLGRLLSAAENGGRMACVTEILILQALAYALQHETAAWQAALDRALTLARPQSMVRLFIDEGLPLQKLLHQLKPENPDQRAFCNKLLAAFDSTPSDPTKSQPLVDPLSERELEILSLVAAGFKNKEIAAELIISLNTVLYHTKNIYGKLGVNKRTLAVAKAREFGLI